MTTARSNVGFNEDSGQFHFEIKGLAEPKSEEATKIVQEDLNEIVATFVQDRRTLERGLFNQELPAEELTQVKMGKIVRDRYPHLTEEDQEAVRQHAIAAINVVQGATKLIESQWRRGVKVEYRPDRRRAPVCNGRARARH